MTPLPRLQACGQDDQGFTLVEILVVIIIIGILAAIAIPIFLNQRRAANDSALTQDMRNIAMAYETWRATDGNDDDRIREITGHRAGSSFVAHEESDYIRSANNKDWNKIEELPDASISRGSSIFFTLPTSTADREAIEGQFCLVGTNVYSQYNYKAGSGNIANYTARMYYDSALGGLKTMAELVESYDPANPESSACYHHIEPYIAAK